MTPLAALARSMFAAAVSAVGPDVLIDRVRFTAGGVEFGGRLLHPRGKLHLVAIGKAAPGLAAAFLRRSRRVPDSVFVLAPDGVPTPAAVAPATRFAAHPVPDARGAAAARELLAALAATAPDDAVVALISGGGSALLAEPLPGADLADAVALTRALLAAGAPIRALNTVRTHLFATAGGRLAAATPAALLALVLSDVPGDDLAVVASGPTVADPTTFADAAVVLERAGVAARFSRMLRSIAARAGGVRPESPKPGDPGLARSDTRLLGSSADALAAAAATARAAGLRPCELTRTLHGEARSTGEALAALATSLAPGEGTALLLAGETTVRVQGGGCGGRNLELALAAARGLAGVPERCLLAAGSDGIDGGAPAAGAVVDGGTLARAAARGRDADAALADNDAWGFFAGAPEAVVTGPTGTNVADLVFVLAAGGVPDFVPAAHALAECGRPLPAGAAPRRGRPPR